MLQQKVELPPVGNELAITGLMPCLLCYLGMCYLGDSYNTSLFLIWIISRISRAWNCKALKASDSKVMTVLGFSQNSRNWVSTWEAFLRENKKKSSKMWVLNLGPLPFIYDAVLSELVRYVSFGRPLRSLYSHASLVKTKSCKSKIEVVH